MSTSTTPMAWAEANAIAENVVQQLAPHCEPGRCVVAGSIRRQCAYVNDIEIVLIPKPYEPGGLFESGIAAVINRWEKVKGDLPCKYTQRILPGGYKADIFLANEDNWGLILALRTGSKNFSHQRLACRWRAMGYTSEGGILHRINNPSVTASIREEEDLFRFIGIPWVPPEERV